MNGPGCPNNGNPSAIFTPGNCTSQGVQLYGGNPHLQPETSVNVNLGAVYSPIEDLAFTVDYYNITVKNLVGSIPSQSVYANPTEFANLYHLNSAGSLSQAPLIASNCKAGPTDPNCGYILQLLQNTGTTKTSGVDLTASYVAHTGYGSFRFGIEGTLITQYDTQEYQGGPTLNLVGQWNQGNEPALRWKHLATVDWTNGAWGAGLSNSFIDKYKDFAPVASPPLNDGNIHNVGNYSVWNGYASWKPVTAVTLTLGVKNLLNTDPPFSNTTVNFQGSYNPLWSSPVGREYYGRVRYSF
jgi:iron complex outermembrane receptor protein